MIDLQISKLEVTKLDGLPFDKEKNASEVAAQIQHKKFVTARTI